MKLVYFGTDVFLPCFLYLAEHHQIMALYTYHEDEDYFTEYAIVKEARNRGIPVHYEDMTKEETIRLFTEEGCQLFFSAEYNRLLPTPEELGNFRGTNLHCSLLPEGRSYYPVESAMERNKAQSGVTLHKMIATLDGGDILDQYVVDITENMDSVDVYLQCGMGAAQMVHRLMEDFDGNWERARRQVEPKKHPYWKRPVVEKLILHHEMTIAEAKACYRCYNQMSQAEIDGVWYFIREMSSGETKLCQDVIKVGEDRVLYGVADGHLRLILQEGKRGGRDGK